jgi:signal peptidase I
MILRWFISQDVRNAAALRKHVRRIFAAQHDLLSAVAIENLQKALADSAAALKSGLKGKALQAEMKKLEDAANKWLKPYPNANWRENVEVLLVALAVAMAVRTFFIQPFKIPTGSMQPTLFGVTSEPDFSRIDFWQNDRSKIEAQINEQLKIRETLKAPTGWERVKEWFAGVTYVHVVAPADGEIEKISQPFRILIFNISQKIKIGGLEQTIWFPPDYGEQTLERRAGLEQGRVYKKGETVVNLRVSAGDHLFVDRLSYNFRRPQRGEIVVFETKGIENPQMPQDQFYIKRLTVLPDERVQIGDDRHMIINGERLDASTPNFSNVYGFNPSKPPHESEFSGHVNGAVARVSDVYPGIAPLFPDGQTVFTNGPKSYMVFGDNTCNSFDSRAWGSFPAKNVIGKSFFVYWPITKRFGWGN